MRRWLTAVTLIVVSGLVSAACSSPDTTSPGNMRYVAIGDSFTAGPGIAPIRESSGACMRSKINYPALVATELKAHLIDVSCSGATTDSVLRKPDRATEAKRQLDAVTQDTDLVTVGIGGNDENYALRLFTECSGASPSAAPCQKFLQDLTSILPRTHDSVVSVIQSIQARAPQAQILLVGYLRLAPEASACELPYVNQQVVSLMADAEDRFAAMLQDVAKATDVGWVDVRKKSHGHDACSAKPWVNVRPSSNGSALHPNDAGMKAVAAMVVDAVD